MVTILTHVYHINTCCVSFIPFHLAICNADAVSDGTKATLIKHVLQQALEKSFGQDSNYKEVGSNTDITNPTVGLLKDELKNILAAEDDGNVKAAFLEPFQMKLDNRSITIRPTKDEKTPAKLTPMKQEKKQKFAALMVSTNKQDIHILYTHVISNIHLCLYRRRKAMKMRPLNKSTAFPSNHLLHPHPPVLVIYKWQTSFMACWRRRLKHTC